MTTIKNIETGEITEITILESNMNGETFDCSENLMDDDATLTSGNDECTFCGTTESIEWWVNYAFDYKYESARMEAAFLACDDDEKKDCLIEKLADCEINDLPSCMGSIADELG